MVSLFTFLRSNKFTFCLISNLQNNNNKCNFELFVDCVKLLEPSNVNIVFHFGIYYLYQPSYNSTFCTHLNTDLQEVLLTEWKDVSLHLFYFSVLASTYFFLFDSLFHSYLGGYDWRGGKTSSSFWSTMTNMYLLCYISGVVSL